MAKTVKVNDVPVTLTAYEYKVLEYLLVNPGKVVSKTELTDHIYDQDFDRDSNVIEVFVGRLRKKLDPDASLKPSRDHPWSGIQIHAGRVVTGEAPLS